MSKHFNSIWNTHLIYHFSLPLDDRHLLFSKSRQAYLCQRGPRSDTSQGQRSGPEKFPSTTHFFWWWKNVELCRWGVAYLCLKREVQSHWGIFKNMLLNGYCFLEKGSLKILTGYCGHWVYHTSPFLGQILLDYTRKKIQFPWIESLTGFEGLDNYCQVIPVIAILLKVWLMKYIFICDGYSAAVVKPR